MADHLDAPGLMSPNADPRLDITDHYAFQKPRDADKTILIFNVNPLAPTLADSFQHKAIYEIKVDTNGDALAEIAFRITFSEFVNGTQFATVQRATGQDAVGFSRSGKTIIEHAPVNFGSHITITERGPYKFYAGLRSDPFFFDLVGFLHGFKFTGSDFFLDKNVYSMVLEVPNWALGDTPKVGIWVRTLKPAGDGDWDDADDFSQDDQMGRPAINTVFNHGADKNTFNVTQPKDMRARFGKSFETTLKSFGYDDAHADAITNILLPDILTYDYSSSAGFLNGRKLTDDVIDISLALVTNGKITTDKVGPHHDYLDEFPYVGQPHK
ncbi:MAG: hypothetical protein NVS4B12_22040 [Ktedonobacteraceae bacterium]